MARFKPGFDVDQGFLLPPSIRDWFPEDHLAWFIVEGVDSLDIAVLLDSYRVGGKGELPYDPKMMLRVLIYAYATGTISLSRGTQNGRGISIAVGTPGSLSCPIWWCTAECEHQMLACGWAATEA